MEFKIHQIVVIAVLALFIYTAILGVRIFKEKKSTKQGILVATNAALLFLMTGVFQELIFRNPDAIRLALCFRYMGEMWFITFFMMLICKISDFKFPKMVGSAIKVINSIFTMLLFLESKTHWMFDVKSSKVFLLTNQTDYLYQPLGWVLMAYIVSLMVVCFVVAFTKYRGKNRPQIVYVITVLVFLSELAYVAYLREMTAGLDFSFVLQILTVHYVFISDRKHHFLDEGHVAQSLILDEAGDGFIILDKDHKVRDYNKIASMLYPELLNEDESKIIAELILLHNHEMLEHNGKKCDVIVSELMEYDDLTGYVVWLYDRTDEYNCITELTRLQNHMMDAARTRDLYNTHMSKGVDSPVNILKTRADSIVNCETAGDDVKEMAGEIMGATIKLADMVGILADYMTDRENEEWPPYDEYSISELIESLKGQLKFHEAGRCQRVEMVVHSGVPDKWYGSLEAILLITANLLRFSTMTSIPASIDVELAMEARFSDSLLNMVFFFADKGSVVGEINRLTAKLQRGEKTLAKEVNYIPYYIVHRTLASLNGSFDTEIFGNSSKIVISIPQRIVGSNVYTSASSTLRDADNDRGASVISRPVSAKVTKDEEEINPVVRAIKEGEQPVVLVVDDNVLYLREMDSCLRKLGAKAIIAKSGAEAIEIYRKKQVDIVFMDHMMPEMDGTQTLAELRVVESEVKMENPVPVILLTADDTVGARKKYLSRGFNDYISKPVEPHEIESKLRAFLGEWR